MNWRRRCSPTNDTAAAASHHPIRGGVWGVRFGFGVFESVMSSRYPADGKGVQPLGMSPPLATRDCGAATGHERPHGACARCLGAVPTVSVGKSTVNKRLPTLSNAFEGSVSTALLGGFPTTSVPGVRGGCRIVVVALRPAAFGRTRLQRPDVVATHDDGWCWVGVRRRAPGIPATSPSFQDSLLINRSGDQWPPR